MQKNHVVVKSHPLNLLITVVMLLLYFFFFFFNIIHLVHPSLQCFKLSTN